MIKIFNKTRKQLLDENKTGRYLKYAIGEIVLVMIGILLALQVNNWNNNRELKKEELKVIKSLHNEFSENLVKFDSAYKFHLRRKKSTETIMSINPESVSIDSIMLLIDRVNANYTFDPFQGIYNSVINSGKIELVSNEELKNKISRIQDLLKDYREEEVGAQTFVKNNLYPFLLKQPIISFNYDSDETTAESAQAKENYIKIIESQEYNNLMLFLRAWMSSIFTEGPILRVEMTTIISLIESEIEKHEN
jgi:nitroimidazol reductase NimA-like FMN-containing flavoprotein (pyridoxamine 5'-phosphate oxidase superfamily)